MHLKQKGHCFGVFLLYTTTIITLPSVGYSSQPDSHLALTDDRNRVLTTRGGRAHPPNRGGKRRLHLDSPQGEESRRLLHSDYLDDRDGTPTETSGGRPERTLTPSMASSTRTDRGLKNRVKLRQSEGKWMYISPNPSNEACSKGKITPVTQGKFYIPGQLEANIPNVGYQADSAVLGKLAWLLPESSSFFPLCLNKRKVTNTSFSANNCSLWSVDQASNT